MIFVFVVFFLVYAHVLCMNLGICHARGIGLGHGYGRNNGGRARNWNFVFCAIFWDFGICVYPLLLLRICRIGLEGLFIKGDGIWRLVSCWDLEGLEDWRRRGGLLEI